MPAKQDFTNFATERPNFFPGQFLLEDDFELQHKYLGDRQTYHNQSLQVSGILEGLEVTPIQDKKEVEIAAGTALDNAGHLLVLKNKLIFSDFGKLKKGALFIQFTQEKTNKQQEEIAESYTRWTENIVVKVANKIPDGAIALCTFQTIGNDEVRIDSAVSQYSGVYLPNATNQDLSLRSGGTANPNLAILNGSLKITGNSETVGNQVIGQNLNVTGKVAIAHESQEADGDALTIGKTLRLGHNLQYGWIQSHNNKPLAINPLGNNVGIGTTDPKDVLEIVAGNGGKALTIRGRAGATSPILTLNNPDNPQATVITPRDGQTLSIEYDGASQFTIENSGKVTIPGVISAKNRLVVGETLHLNGAKKIIFSDEDVSNNLKIQLWSGYGLGINGSTLFYAADGNHSWRNKKGGTERMKLTTAADGGLTVYGTGDSSFAGNLNIAKTLKVTGSLNLNVFSTAATDEWPQIIWLRDLTQKWDEGLIKNGTASRGAFGRLGFGVHLHEDREFGLWSTNFKSLFAVEGGSGNTKITGKLFVMGGNDVKKNSANSGTLLIGDAAAKHLAIDNNEIMAKESGTTVGTLNLQNDGGTTVIGGSLTMKGAMTGIPEGYIKAQFALSGGGIVSWGGINKRLKWTQRFIAISMQRSTFFPAGYIDIFQPTTNIPKAHVWNGQARSADASGVVLKDWEALYAVHSLNGNQSAVSYRIVKYTNDTNPPSNWILVAVVNSDDGSVKLGSGQIIHKAQRNDFVVAGFVRNNGTIVSGSGFTVSKGNKGFYDITFTRPFSTRPAIVATQHNGDGSNTKDNAIVTVINEENCRIKTGDGSGDASDRHFCFFAMGTV